ncbi:MAG: hypothetical protein IJM32_10600 [Ruminococcus sp.]|nr:hypothetical protein [Ruminococcus sp.]
MKKRSTSKLTKTITAMAAAVMMTSTVTSLCASADTTKQVTTLNTSAAMNSAMLTKTSGEKLDEAARKLNEALLNGSIDYASAFIPGGKLIAQPMKLLVSAIYDVDSGPDPIDVLTDQEQAHFEQLSKMIADLDANMGKYAEMLTKQVDTVSGKRTLGEVFSELSTNLRDLVDRVNAITECDNYSKKQKLLLIANINNGSCRAEQYLVNVRQACDAISKTLNYDGSLLTVDFFGTLLELGKPGSMFYDEALAKAKAYAEPLITQYMYANYMLSVCQDAYTLLDITPEEAKEICTTSELRDAYEKCTEAHDKAFQTEKLAQTYDRTRECIEAYKRFEDKKKQTDKHLINGGNVDFELTTVFKDFTSNEDWYQNFYIRDDSKGREYFMDHYQQILEHIKETNPAGAPRTMRQYLTENGIEMNHSGKSYMMVCRGMTDTRGKQVGEKEVVRHCGNEYWIVKIPMYEYTCSVKVIDIDDPEMKIIELPLLTCHVDSNGDRIENAKWHTFNFCYFK